MNPMDFAIPEQDKKPFSRYFNKHIAPKCHKYEQIRLEAAMRYNQRAKVSRPITYIGLGVFFIGLALCVYAAVVLGGEGHLFIGAFLSAFLAFVIVAAVNMWAGGELCQLRTRILNDIYPLVIRYFGDSFALNPSPLPELKAYKVFGILPDFDRGGFQDSLRGTYKHIPFLLRELTLEKEAGSKDGRMQYKTIFDGILLQFDIPKRFSGMTQIRQDKGLFGNGFNRMKSSLSRVKLEDVAFEQAFEVYSDDQIEARYLLTTAMMERLLSLSRFYDSQLEASFKDGKLVIKIASKHNYFESKLNIHQQLDVSADIELLFRELNEVFAVIDALKLDNKTGL